MVKIISSQCYIDDKIVAQKQNAGDYVVSLSPAFNYDGETYQAIMDGHHSLEAARLDGIKPDYIEIDEQACDYLHLAQTDPEAFLQTARIDSDYYDVETGIIEW